MKRQDLLLRLRSILISIVFIVIVLLAVILLVPKWIGRGSLIKQEKGLEEAVEALEDKNLKLKQEKDALENDPVYLEKIARDELGLKRADEIIYKFEDE
ncbi:MAG: septum formation initiator family protein [Candidatus Aureabacteria bacterium]|nr:septum formation initiator family protein [Candidatus Auribacterota bacterium]